MSIVHEMLVHGFSLPFYKLLQEMPMCGVFLITRDFHITIKEDKSVRYGLCPVKPEMMFHSIPTLTDHR
jgi:hypothetical protein